MGYSSESDVEFDDGPSEFDEFIENLVGKSKGMKHLTAEDIDEIKFSFDELSPSIQKALGKNGIKELFPV